MGSLMNRGASKLRPWLMLPPWFEGGEMVYRFYDLVEKRQVSVEKRGVGGEKDPLKVPHDDSVVVGSSQGWLALFNKRNRDLFLSNPLTRHHIKLSPIQQLQIPAQELMMSDLVGKVIPACDPNDGRLSYCTMIYGPREQLAFCTPRGFWRNLSQRSYGDCTYCSKYEVFFAAEKEEEIEAWNVQRYKQDWMVGMGNQGDLYKQLPSCFIHQSLVVAEHRLLQLQLYDVARYVRKIDHKTVGFAVRKYNWEERAWRHMDGSLDGLSFFLGRNDSFATELDCPHLKRDAIYFTDHHDVGMFCYATQQLSSLYYPRLHNHASTTTTAPIFFTPSTRV